MTTGLPLFDAPRLPQITACSDSAVSRGWDADAAKQFILDTLSTGPAFSQDIVEAACASGLDPSERRAFGGLFASLAHEGLIERDSYRTRSNGSPGLVWRRRTT